MSSGRTGARRPRGSLTSDAIVVAAMQLIETQGLSNLSMASLAREMGVPVTSIHWHFRSREDLLDVLAERVTADLEEALPSFSAEGPWDEELVAGFVALRRELLAMSSFLGLAHRARVVPSSPLKNSVTRRLESGVDMLVQAGFSSSDAYRLYHLCSVYVRGFVVLELSAAHKYQQPHTPEGDPQPRGSQLTAANSDLILASWHDADSQFNLGLEALVAGMKPTLAKRARSATRRSPRSSASSG